MTHNNHPTRTPTSHLHDTLNNEPITVIIHRLTVKFFGHCPSHPNPDGPTNRELYVWPTWLICTRNKWAKHILLFYKTFHGSFTYSLSCYRNNSVTYPRTFSTYFLYNKSSSLHETLSILERPPLNGGCPHILPGRTRLGILLSYKSFPTTGWFFRY